MKWPFVSRARYIAEADARCDLADAYARLQQQEQAAQQVASLLRDQCGQLERANMLLVDHHDVARADVREQREWNRALVQQIVDLKRDGFAATRARPERQVIPSQPTLEEIGERGATEELIRHMAEDFRRNGVEEQMALKEARRLAKAIEPGFIGVNE